MQSRLSYDLMAATSSTLYSTDRIKELLQSAHLWATGFFDWPELQRGRKTTLPAVLDGEQYIDYPEDFRTDTLTEFIYVDGKPYRKKTWNDFQEHKRLNPTSTKRVFGDFGRQIFIFPYYTVGVQVDMWGQIQAEQMTLSSDITIFSKRDETGNEAIVRKAFADAVRRSDSTLADSEEKNAIGLLTTIWNKVAGRQQYKQPLNKSMFNIPNFFPGNQGMITGNFAVDLGLEED